ncbi:PREDICTED: F-box/kelch-repeat protein At3g16580-like [Camelina sativa]|uniref:F-box/kelch-repeat protein At3g16580-like n=1 Tax=Camelina sativa TaxID=90675 RepID=A0ABM0WBA4_CAMSA|nr:PREDICTED: F-box/kelch-repeat protein At3g16580-like [Camelina sativa]
MAHEEKLPLELTEEILSRVPPTSLVRFTTVSKQWNALFHDKTFIKNHKITFRFILTTKSKIYLVSIDPKIEVCELTLDIPGLDKIYKIPKILVDCDKLLVCGMERGAVVWNPCLRQSRWIEQDSNQTQLESLGVGYNSSGSYKIVAGCRRKEGDYSKYLWKVHDLASNAWEDGELESGGNLEKRPILHNTSCVSLNGNLYGVVFVSEADHVYSVYKFDYSNEHFFRFCYLPCGTTDHFMDALVLGAFEGDRFSLLKQCHATKKIEVWVSKYKINNSLDSEGVEWIMFMKVSSPNLPDLVDINYTQPSYFIEDKRLVVCSCDETGRAWIYVFGENSLISKTHIDYVVDHWPSHYTFIPSLVPVPVKVNEKN